MLWRSVGIPVWCARLFCFEVWTKWSWFSCTGFENLIHPLLSSVFIHTSCALQAKKCKNKHKPGHMKGQGLYIHYILCHLCRNLPFLFCCLIQNLGLAEICCKRFKHDCQWQIVQSDGPCSFQLIFDAWLTYLSCSFSRKSNTQRHATMHACYQPFHPSSAGWSHSRKSF